MTKRSLETIHDLHAGFGVERARRLVCENDIRVVDQRARDGDALHLTAGHFARSLTQLIAQTNLRERVFGAAAPFGLGNAR